MKYKWGIITMFVFFLFIGMFLFFQASDFGISSFVKGEVNFKPNLIGYSILNKSLNFEIKNYTNVTVTREDVVLAIEESEIIMEELRNDGFSIVFMNDTILEAKRILERVDKAEILRGNLNASQMEISNARDSLRLVEWKDMRYSDVLHYTDLIKFRKEQAYIIFDSYNLIEKEVLDFYGNEIDISLSIVDEKGLLYRANESFYEDRYDEAILLIEEAKLKLEEDKSNIAIIASLRNGLRTFLEKYWIQTLIFLLILIFIGKYYYIKFNISRLKNKIVKMEEEKRVLNKLMRKTQRERFQDNSISGLVYKVRMDRFKKRTNEIDQQIPVLKIRLEKMKEMKVFSFKKGIMKKKNLKKIFKEKNE